MWQIADDAVWEERDGLVFVTLPHDPHLLALDEVGSHIWLSLPSDSAHEIASAFEGDPVTVVEGIETFLDDLCAKGLVSRG